eukprot:1163094-Rhodomonas_salina.1
MLRLGNTRSRVPLATNDLERALAAENLTCKAEPLERRDWTGDAQPSAAFVSCSEDGTIRVWDALDRVLVSSRDLVPANGRASNGSHDGVCHPRSSDASAVQCLGLTLVVLLYSGERAASLRRRSRAEGASGLRLATNAASCVCSTLQT